MEYTYNLAEIRGIIDGVLTDLSRSMRLDGQAEDSVQITKLAGLETEAEHTDSCISAENGETELDALDIDNQPRQDNNQLVEVKTSCKEDRAQESEEMAPAAEGSVDIPATQDQKLVAEDMSLKVVLTYFFYVDDSPASVEKDSGTGSAEQNLKDDEASLDKKELSEDCERDSGAEASSESDSCDFDADIDSLDDDDEGSGQSYKLQSFSMMNIFDSVCDDNYDFTGSLDFEDGNLYRERVGSDSDKDTLDWLSDSSEDVLSEKHEEIEHDSEDNEQESSTAARGDATVTSGTLDTARKFYKGSTFSVSKCNSEIRQKLVKRLFRKVFPKKKYVVNKKK